MNEEEWNACTDPVLMLELVQRSASATARKLRLFAAACCRLYSPLVEDERFSQTVQTIEQYADGLASKAALKRSRQAVRAARYALPADQEEAGVEWQAYWLAEVAGTENAYKSMVVRELQRLATATNVITSAAFQPSAAALLRDVFVSPFRAVPPIEPAWLTSTVVSIARRAYDERDFAALPVLGDALEEAGCGHQDVLRHCGEPRGHVRGCWVLDLLTGRE
jgi:hypothetical protein